MADKREMQTVVGGRSAQLRQGPSWIDGAIDPFEGLVRSVLSIGGGELEQMEAIAPDCPSTLFTVFEERGRLPWFRRKTPVAARNLRMVGGNPTRLSFPEDSFDLVGCQFLLGLPLDPVPIIREAVRVCAPGGQILLQDLSGPPVESWFGGVHRDPVFNEIDTVLRELRAILFFGDILSRSLEKLEVDEIRVSIQSCPGGQDWKHSIERRLWAHKLHKAVPIAVSRLDDDRPVEAIIEGYLDRLDPARAGNQPVMCSVLGRKSLPALEVTRPEAG